MADGWRYIAQRFNGSTGSLGEFIEFNVPLEGVDLQDVLSGHNALTATIAPEYPRLRGQDGRLILERGGTAIWAEDPSGEIVGGGLLTHSSFGDNGTWEIECSDLTATSIDLPFLGANWFTHVDPIAVYRFIWAHIQSFGNHNLGITIDDTRSPVLLGTTLVQFDDFDLEPDVSDDLDPAPAATTPPRYATNALWREAAVKALKARAWKDTEVDEALKKWLSKDALTEARKWTPLTEKERRIRDRAIETIGWPPFPPNPGPRNITNVVYERRAVQAPEGGTIEETAPETEPAKFQFDAYKLNWYETLDLSATMDDLAASTPFDWHLTHRWEGDEIRHHIRVGYPKLGRRREDLRFVVGENIHQVPTVEEDGSIEANEVIVYGAGEGSSIIWGRAFRNDGKVRKVATVSDPTIRTTEAANARAQQELAKRVTSQDIAEIVVVDHPHASLGSIDLGDEIYVEGDLGWVDFSAWCRVVARSISPDSADSHVLTVLRSDRIA